MKTILASSPIHDKKALKDIWYEPLNLIYIATFLAENGYEVEIIDGNLHSRELSLDSCNADIVGLTFNSFNIPEMEVIAQILNWIF